MQSNRTLELGTGLFVLLGFVALFFLATQLPSIRLDPKTFQAVVGLRIYPKYNEIPDDSFASIQTQGLLGGKYVGLSPGGSETFLKEGSHIDQTQSAIVLESLINKLFASFSSKAGGGDSSSAPAPADDTKKQEPKK